MTHPGFQIPGDFEQDNSYTAMLTGEQSLASYWEYQRYLEAVNNMIDKNAGCRHAKIGILDTGIDWDHVLLKLLNIAKVDEFVNDGSGGKDRRSGHGTIVAHQIFRQCPNAEFYIAKVLGDGGSGSSNGILRGAEWLASHGCQYINASLGSSQPYRPFGEFLEEYRKFGLFLAASGNAGFVEMGWPAAWGMSKGCAPIGAHDSNYKRAGFSQVGNKLVVCGAGVNIRAARAGSSGETQASGTSMGTPHTTGQVVNIDVAYRRKGYKDTPYDLYEKEIPKFTTDMAEPGRDRATGFGFIDFQKISDFIDAESTGIGV